MPAARRFAVVSYLRSSPTRLLLLSMVMVVLLAAGIVAIIGHTLTADHVMVKPDYTRVEVLARDKRLVVGIDLTASRLVTMVNGQPQGLEVDLAKSLARQMELPVDFKQVSATQLVNVHGLGQPNALSTGQIHILIASISQTSQLQQYFRTSQPYLSVSQVAVGLAGQSVIKQVAELDGKTVAVVKGSVNQELVALRQGRVAIKMTETSQEAVDMVYHHQVDVSLLDSLTAKAVLASQKGLVLASEPLAEEVYVIVSAKNQTALGDYIDQTLDTLTANGVLDSLQRKWLWL